MAEPMTPARNARPKRVLKWLIPLILILAAAAAVPLMKFGVPLEWNSDSMLATYIVSGFVILCVLLAIIVMKTARTRYKKEQLIKDQPEVHEYVILWNYPRWALYLPSIVLALIAGVITLLVQKEWFFTGFPLGTMGAVMLTVVFLDVCVEQFHLSIRTLLIAILSVATVLLVLHLSGHAAAAVRLLRHAKVEIPAKVYFFSVFTVALVIFIGWIKGLFNYIAITPNTADLQRGATETGEHIQTRDYNIQLDTSDFVERWIFGFGRVIITFRDRAPATYFVPRASRIAERIGRVRGVLAIDHFEGASRRAAAPAPPTSPPEPQ